MSSSATTESGSRHSPSLRPEPALSAFGWPLFRPAWLLGRRAKPADNLAEHIVIRGLIGPDFLRGFEEAAVLLGVVRDGIGFARHVSYDVGRGEVPGKPLLTDISSPVSPRCAKE